MRSPVFLACFLSVFSVLESTAFANESVNERPVAAGTCAGCHGPEGQSLSPTIPSIAGLSEKALLEAMRTYRDGQRNSQVMAHITQSYSDNELQDLAKYFADLPYRGAAQDIDTEQVATGKRLHDEYCEKCHVQQGTVNRSNINRMDGQWVPYLISAALAFYEGKRPQPDNMAQKLRAMVETEGLESLESIAYFYGSLNQTQAEAGTE